MHEECVVGHCHLTFINSPRHILQDYLSVVFGTSDTWATPVLGIDEVCSFECLHLVVFHAGIAHKLRVELIAFGMRHDEIHVGSVHPFCKRIRNSLWQSSWMWSPSEHNLWFSHVLLPFIPHFPIFLNGDEVGKCLKRMHSGALHEEHRSSAVFDELVENLLLVVVLTVFKTSKGAHTDDVAIAAHHGDGLQQVFALVAIHHDSAFSFQLPSALVHIEHDDVHAEVHGCFLCAETRAQTVVEENQQRSLVLAQSLVLEAILFDVECFLHGNFQVAYIAYMLKYFHILKLRIKN